MTMTLLGFVAAFVLIFLQVLNALALGLVGALGYALLTGFKPMLGMLVTLTEANTLTYSLTVIPLFVSAGRNGGGWHVFHGIFRRRTEWRPHSACREAGRR